MYTWNRNGLPDRDQACGCQGDEGGRRMDREFGIRGCKLVYIGWVNNKVILYSTRNCIQCPVINQKEKEYEMGLFVKCIFPKCKRTHMKKKLGKH